MWKFYPSCAEAAWKSGGVRIISGRVRAMTSFELSCLVLVAFSFELCDIGERLWPPRYTTRVAMNTAAMKGCICKCSMPSFAKVRHSGSVFLGRHRFVNTTGSASGFATRNMPAGRQIRRDLPSLPEDRRSRCFLSGEDEPRGVADLSL